MYVYKIVYLIVKNVMFKCNINKLTTVHFLDLQSYIYLCVQTIKINSDEFKFVKFQELLSKEIIKVVVIF